MAEQPRDVYGRFAVPSRLGPHPEYRPSGSMLRHHAAWTGTPAKRAASTTPSTSLAAFGVLRYHVERLELFAVANARGLGWSWQEIAESIGMSKQALQKRYGGKTIAPHPRKRRARY